MHTDKSITRFEQLYKSNYERMYYIAYDFVGDSEDARDVVSDVFTKVWNTRQTIDLEKIDGLLFVMVRNGCMDMLRKRQRNERYINACLASMDEEAESTMQEIEERTRQVQKELDELPPRTRFVIEECCCNDRTYKEVAEILQITTSGVKQHIVKGYKQLRERLRLK